MKPESQRIAIAEACGWNSIREQDYDYGYSGDDVRQMWVGLSPDSDEFEQLPDYLNDLNAMHEAEKVLKVGAQLQNYRDYLWGISKGNSTFSTAAQRAEAFLKTLGKWEEEA